jgi:site-specific recombinase XerD
MKALSALIPRAQKVNDFRGSSVSPSGDLQSPQGEFKSLELEMKSRGFSPKTVKSYLYHNKHFHKHLKRSTEGATEDQIKNYITLLLENQSPNTANLALASIKFFHRTVVGKDLDIHSPKKEQKIPNILTKEEVQEMISLTKNIKHKILLELLYGCGLRVSEAAKIKISDLDLKEKILKINQGKGGKDRYVPIPTKTSHKIEFLLRLTEDTNPYLFPSGHKDGYHISIKTIQCVVKQAADRAQIKKNIHPHTLRHSYATHLLEQGTDIRIIQKLLGHAKLDTTQLYTQVSTQLIKNVTSPLDNLPDLTEYPTPKSEQIVV